MVELARSRIELRKQKPNGEATASDTSSTTAYEATTSKNTQPNGTNQLSIGTAAERLERILSKPQSLEDFIVKYIIDNKEDLIEALGSLGYKSDDDGQVKRKELQQVLMGKFVFPGIESHVMISTDPERMKKFVQKYLSRFIEVIAKETAEIDTNSAFLFSKIWRRRGDTPYDRKDVPGDKKEMIDVFFGMIWDRTSYEKDQNTSLASLLREIEQIVRRYFIQGDMACNKIFTDLQTPAHLIYEGISGKFKTKGEVSSHVWQRHDDISAFLESIVFEMCGIQICDMDESEMRSNKTAKISISSRLFKGLFDQLEKTKQQVTIHMLQQAVRERTFETYGFKPTEHEPVEVRFLRDFDQDALGGGVFKRGKKYVNAEPDRFFAFFGAKNREKEKIEKEKVDEEVENFYKLAEYCFKLFEVGRIYASTPEHSERGEITMEIARIHAEKLKSIAANLEVKLSVGDFAMDDLDGLINALSGFMSSSALERAISSGSSSMTSMQQLSDAEREVEALLEKK